MIKITLPDNSSRKFQKNISGTEIAKSISNKFCKKCIAIEINKKTIDLNTKLTKNSKINFITSDDPIALEIMRHSTAHIMAQAITNLYPKAKLAIGPVIKDGFYYDIEIDSISSDDFFKIEYEMKKIIKNNYCITKKQMSKEEVFKIYKNNSYKLEIISEIKDKEITIYKQNNFLDLCRGPHLPSTGFVKNFKLIRISGAYWRSNQSNKQLQRIYGTAFLSKKELNSYLYFLDESKKRNHKKIGLSMNLFSFHNESPGMPIFHPKGVDIWNNLLEYWKEEHKKSGYLEIKTPLLLEKKLWIKSGHWSNYEENIYTTLIDKKDYVIKPMNCPGSMLYYNTNIHSYKELPIKISEIGLVHRHEMSGVLNGLFRVRSFHQDDAHIFLMPEQIKEEIIELLNLEKKIYKTFDLEFEIELSTKPKKFIGTEKQWEIATNSLKSALENFGKSFKIREKEGAFYGPKIDLHVKDSLNRTWQCGTIQLDLSMPERFKLKYINKNNKKCEPVVIHRTVFGSMERFFGILIEHFSGKFPLWLSPTQVIILPINDNLINPSKKIFRKMESLKIRSKIDSRSSSLNKKIRDAQISKIPIIVIYGEKEKETNTLSIRTLDNKTKKNVDISNFIKNIHSNIKKRKKEIKFN